MNPNENKVNQFVNKQEFCRICGISESTGYKLLKTGKIQYKKCSIGLLHFYQIPVSEIERYKSENESKGILDKNEVIKRRKFYLSKTKNYPDVISAKDICTITEYGKEAVRQWINGEKILGIVVRKRFKVAKEDLIDFLVTPYYENITRKSETHKKDNELIFNI